MARPYSQDLRDRVVASVTGGRIVPGDGGAVWGERRQRGEVVTALSGDRQCGGQADGRTPAAAVAGERDWLLARIAEKPDLTLRAVMAELAARGIAASYGAVWRFFAHEGITFKKKPARQRTGSPRRRPAARPVEEASGPA